MKKRFISLLFLIAILVMPFICYAQQSAVQTTDAAITAKPGQFMGILVATDGTNSVTLDVYDNGTAGSGTKIFPSTVITTSASNRVQAIGFSKDDDVRYQDGIYVDITVGGGGSCSYQVYFIPD